MSEVFNTSCALYSQCPAADYNKRHGSCQLLHSNDSTDFWQRLIVCIQSNFDNSITLRSPLVTIMIYF